jgi:hypothetical protein
MSHNEHTPVHHEHVDEWHLHTAAEGEPQAEHMSKINPYVLIVVFVVSVVFLVAFIGATIIYAKGYVSSRRATKVEVTTWAVDARAQRAQDEMRLSEYGWVDPAQGRVRVPVDVVMQEMSGHGLGIPAPGQMPGQAPGQTPGQTGRPNPGTTGH